MTDAIKVHLPTFSDERYIAPIPAKIKLSHNIVPIPTTIGLLNAIGLLYLGLFTLPLNQIIKMNPHIKIAKPMNILISLQIDFVSWMGDSVRSLKNEKFNTNLDMVAGSQMAKCALKYGSCQSTHIPQAKRMRDSIEVKLNGYFDWYPSAVYSSPYLSEAHIWLKVSRFCSYVSIFDVSVTCTIKILVPS